MAKQNLTKWFPPNVKPVHVGVYEVDMSQINPKFDAVFQHWNGAFFGHASTTAAAAFSWRNEISVEQEFHWRGLAEKPE
jgi:hypothetical protein